MLAQTTGILFFSLLCFVEGMLVYIMLQSHSTKRKPNLCLETKKKCLFYFNGSVRLIVPQDLRQ